MTELTRKTIKIKTLMCSLCMCSAVLAQQFETISPDFIPGPRRLQLGKILCSSKGTVLIAHSFGVAEIDKMQIEILTATAPLTDIKGNKTFPIKNTNIFKDQYDSITGIQLICKARAK